MYQAKYVKILLSNKFLIDSLRLILLSTYKSKHVENLKKKVLQSSLMFRPDCTESHLNSPSRKNNSSMHCMPTILLFVQSAVSSFYLVCYDYIEHCFLFIALFGIFVQLNLPHSSVSPLIKYFIQVLHNAFLVSV